MLRLRAISKCFLKNIHTEPTLPKVVTNQILNDSVSSTIKEKMPIESFYFSVDYKNSYGNYLKDSGNNDILDMYTQIASIPIGYNNEFLKTISRDENMIQYLVNRPALGILPPSDLNQLIDDSLMKICPKGLDGVITMMCGSCSVENAVKAAFFKFQENKLGRTDFTQEELETCMLNQAPGCPDLTVLSFNGGFHGRTFASLSLTRSKPIHKIGMPLFDWPMAEFPKVQYPMDSPENEATNRKAVDDSLRDVRDKILEFNEKQKPIAAVVIEPIQCEGGDRFAPAYFFHELQAICKKNKISLIIDEVQTGGGTTGSFWYHERWNLPSPPDFLTFSKRMQSGGFYMNKSNMTKIPYRIFNTWMGEPSKLYLLKNIIEYIEKHKLLHNVQETGNYLVQEISSLAKSNPQLRNVRGAGFIIGMDVGDKLEDKDVLWKKLLQRGILTGVCGTSTIRLRPHLIFERKHADIFLDILESSVKELY